jgi:hypothetical protein
MLGPLARTNPDSDAQNHEYNDEHDLLVAHVLVCLDFAHFTQIASYAIAAVD